jgi:hypothetical protein
VLSRDNRPDNSLTGADAASFAAVVEIEHPAGSTFPQVGSRRARRAHRARARVLGQRAQP